MRHEFRNRAEFISEDIAISDGNQIFAVPWTSTFRYYPSVDQRPVARLLRRAMAAFPVLDLFPVVRNRSITDYVPEARICHKSKVNHLVILERGSDGVTKISREIALRKIINLNRAEFNYQRSLVNNAYEYFNPELDIAGACDNEKAILKKLVENADECILVRSDNPMRYADLILVAVS